MHSAHLPGIADRRRNRINVRQIDRHQREAICSTRRDEAILERCLQETLSLLWVAYSSSDPASSVHATVCWPGHGND